MSWGAIGNGSSREQAVAAFIANLRRVIPDNLPDGLPAKVQTCVESLAELEPESEPMTIAAYGLRDPRGRGYTIIKINGI